MGGIECVIWPYWIQRCIANVRAIFDDSINVALCSQRGMHLGVCAVLFNCGFGECEMVRHRFGSDMNAPALAPTHQRQPFSHLGELIC